MPKDEVVTLMKGSTSVDDWNDRADRVKAACGGYPDFWWAAIIQSGVADRTLKQFGADADLHFSTF